MARSSDRVEQVNEAVPGNKGAGTGLRKEREHHHLTKVPFSTPWAVTITLAIGAAEAYSRR
jgi:hypothetical protein